MPRLTIVGGPNGAGKSTLIRLCGTGDVPVISPDTISAETGASPPDAGREALRQRQKLIEAGKSLVLDTTFSGPSLPRLMKSLVTKGWQTSLVFVGLRDTLLAEQRVAMRVRAGEHDVPVEDIERRYARSMRNLRDHWRIPEQLFVIDNSGPRHRLLLHREHGTTDRLVSTMPPWVETEAPELVP